MAPLQKKLRGVRDSIPQGYILGRTSAGLGPPELIHVGDLQRQIVPSASASLEQLGTATQGTIMYRGATAWSLLPPGTSGFVLQTNGPGADPTWAAATGGGGTAYAYWRVLALALDGGAGLGISEVKMSTAAGGAQAATGGTAIGSPPSGTAVDPSFLSVTAQFDFEGGTVTDESPGHTTVTSPGVTVPSPGVTVPTKYGTYSALFYTAASTAGTTYIGLPLASTAFSTGDFTLEGWAYMTSNPGRMVLFSQYDSATVLFQVMMWPTNFQVFVNSTTPVVNVTISITTGSWHHWAVSRSGTTLKCFLDGVLIATYASFPASYPTFSAAAKIGSETTTGNWGWVGYMDNVRVTKVARYSATFTPSNDLGNTAVTTTPDQAFDGSTSTYFAAMAAAGGWIGYHFSAAVTIKEIILTARVDTPNTAPIVAVVQASADGIAWRDISTIAATPGWTAGQAQTFELP